MSKLRSNGGGRTYLFNALSDGGEPRVRVHLGRLEHLRRQLRGNLMTPRQPNDMQATKRMKLMHMPCV
jgi:hypothetical protein